MTTGRGDALTREILQHFFSFAERRDAAKKKRGQRVWYMYTRSVRACCPASPPHKFEHARCVQRATQEFLIHAPCAYANACACMHDRGCTFSRAAQSTAWCLKRVLSLRVFSFISHFVSLYFLPLQAYGAATKRKWSGYLVLLGNFPQKAGTVKSKLVFLRPIMFTFAFWCSS